MKNADALEITRRIPEKKTTMKTLCFPGLLTVLIDEAGDGVLHSYLNTFAGKDVNNRFSFQLRGSVCDPTKQERIGFGERLPDDATIPQFLLECGFSPEESEKLIEKYDLEQFSYLTCGALNPTATRQLQLLKAFHSDSPILLCNDPFQPFSGRWREEFAKLFLKTIEGTDRIVVVTSLSFMPQSWAQDNRIKTIDVGKAAEAAKKKAEAEARRQAALEEQRKLAESMAKAAAEAAEDMPDLPNGEKDPSKEIPINLPDNVKFAYRAVNDFIFTPLANLSNAARTYSLLIVPGAIVCIGLMIGLIMYPNMSERQIRKFASNSSGPVAGKITTKGMNAEEELGDSSLDPVEKEIFDSTGAVIDAKLPGERIEELPGKPIYIEKIKAIIEAEGESSDVSDEQNFQSVKSWPQNKPAMLDNSGLSTLLASLEEPTVCEFSSEESCNKPEETSLSCQ